MLSQIKNLLGNLQWILKDTVVFPADFVWPTSPDVDADPETRWGPQSPDADQSKWQNRNQPKSLGSKSDMATGGLLVLDV